jgi:hypothetical protein
VIGVGVAVVVVVAVVVALVVGGGSDDKGAAVKDPLAEALSFAPAAAPAVVQFDVQPSSPQGKQLRALARTFPAARFAADGIRQSVASLGLDADADLPDLLGGPLVAWGPPKAITSLATSFTALRLELAPVLKAGVTAAVVGKNANAVATTLDRAARDGRLTKRGNHYILPQNAGVIGTTGPDVVLGKDAATVDEAIRLHANQGGLTTRAFTARLGPLARRPALIRATANARAIASPRAAGVPWVDALRGSALTVAIAKPGVDLKIRLATDPTKITDADLPLAPGDQPPQPAPGPRPIHAAVRDLAQTIKVLDAAKDDLDLPFLDPIKNALGTLDSVKGPLKTFGRIDVDAALIDQLTGTTTITAEPPPNTIAIRAELKDGGPLRTALNRIAAVPDFALNLANVDLNVDRDGDAYTITNKGKPSLKVAVLGTTLVVTNDLHAGLRAIANRKPTAPATDDRGALQAHADGTAVQDEIIRRFNLPALSRLVLGGFGDLNASARAERSGVDLDATLTLNK